MLALRVLQCYQTALQKGRSIKVDPKARLLAGSVANCKSQTLSIAKTAFLRCSRDPVSSERCSRRLCQAFRLPIGRVLVARPGVEELFLE